MIANIIIHHWIDIVSADIFGLFVVLFLTKSGTLESTWVGTIWNEWHAAPHSGVKRWSRISNEMMNFLIHVSLGNIWLLVMLLLTKFKG